jgi:acetyl-CoA synthetase
MFVCVQLANRLDELGKITEALERLHAANPLPSRLRYAANLAVEELVVNTIRYAYDDQAEHRIDLHFSVFTQAGPLSLEVRIEDEGREFNPFSVVYEEAPPRVSLEDLEDVCLGIHFVRILADSYAYHRREGRNVVTLHFVDAPDRQTISSVLEETRVFPPPAAFSQAARIRSVQEYRRLYRRSIEDPEAFWAERAEELDWFRRWDRVLEEDFPNARHSWFLGGKLNVSYNCLDRHLSTSCREKTALIWEGDDPADQRRLTYAELHREVCRFANVLKLHGVKKGDRVAIYMPMVPELPVAMLACARIGAVHSVVFGGFSADSLRNRMIDCGATALICADGYFRGGKLVRSKDLADQALAATPGTGAVLVLRRAGCDVTMTPGRDYWWHEETARPEIDDLCEPEPMDSEDPLFILYTSGSTGKPKGVLHTTAGYLLYAAQTFQWVFDVRDRDVYWCTADCGWVTGHSYVVYGPLANGATSLLFEGVPGYPQPDRFWDMVERYRVSLFYTAPTALRALMKEGDAWPNRHDLSSLRLLGTVGEPINPEAWMWYHSTIGKGRCPIVDTWWQTETGGILISPVPGAVATKPGSATLPLFGIAPAVIKENGAPAGVNEGGFLVIRQPWPGLMRRVYGDPDRFRKTYFVQFPGVYATGDSARVDADGYFWLMGRVDDVINVSGHRLGTAEIESALVSHHGVAEAAVVGAPHEIKGQGIYAYVTLKTGVVKTPELATELKRHVRSQIGAIAAPDCIQFADGLPKTRSGKIMRRILTKIAAGDVSNLGDTTTLLDPGVIEDLVAGRRS